MEVDDMLSRKRILVFMAGMLCMSTIVALAVHKDVTVKYLNAALGSLQIRDRVSVTAFYVGSEGMTEAVRGPLRNKGLTQFYIKDPASSAVFELMYCDVESSIFKTLIKINNDTTAFVFEGIKTQGSDSRGAILVKSIRQTRNIPKAVTISGPASVNSSPDKYRIIMIDQATSNRTVTVDVELGKKYDIMGNTIIIEDMNPRSKDVKVMQ